MERRGGWGENLDCRPQGAYNSDHLFLGRTPREEKSRKTGNGWTKPRSMAYRGVNIAGGLVKRWTVKTKEEGKEKSGCQLGLTQPTENAWAPTKGDRGNGEEGVGLKNPFYHPSVDGKKEFREGRRTIRCTRKVSSSEPSKTSILEMRQKGKLFGYTAPVMDVGIFPSLLKKRQKGD